MLNNERGQSLIEVLVVLVLAAMMIIALITIVLVSLKNAQFAQNQTKATKLAQDTMDQIRILRDSNQNKSLQPDDKCFNELWNNASDSEFYCQSDPLNNPDGYCFYKLSNSKLEKKNSASLAKEDLGDGFTRQIKVIQNTSSEVKIAVDVSWSDSTGEHSSNLETYLIKPNYDCID